MSQASMSQAAAPSLGQAFDMLTIATPGSGLHDVTREVAERLSALGAADGVVTLFIRHTSASLVVQENADPDVLTDLDEALDRLAPRNHRYHHAVEGPDDMPAHIKAMVTATSLAIPVRSGRMLLGTWQGIYVAEHRDRPHRREIAIAFQGTLARDSASR